MKDNNLLREITRNFINEASVFGRDKNQGPATQSLKRAGVSAVKGEGITALRHLVKALQYQGAYEDPQKEAGLRSLQTFIEKLNDAIDPDNLKNFKTDDIAIEAIRQALHNTNFPSGDAELSIRTSAPVAGEFKVKG